MTRARVREVSRDARLDALLQMLYAADSVLDVGPGINPAWFFTAHTHICVEAHRPYVARLQATHGSDPRFVFLAGRGQDVLPHLPDDSIDTAVALDVIEHLDRADGFALLDELTRIARQQVVIATPLGFYPQEFAPGQSDRWGMDGGHWQTHRSGWTPDDMLALDPRWSILLSPDFHQVDQHNRPLDQPWPAFWAVFTKVEPVRRPTLYELQQRGGRLGKLPAPLRDSIRAVRRLVRSGGRN